MSTETIIASTTHGKLEGESRNGVNIFRGIPYAAPPVGEFRWRAPQPVQPWDGVRSALTFGPVSHQHPLPPSEIHKGILDVPGRHSEDCLYLNVWTPGLDDAKRPVLFWIHSGGLEYGSGSQPLYDGTALAANRDVVVVTINYRLGALGYLRLKDLTGGMIPSTGNEGRMDEIAALTWVRDNIAGFGGDPDNVTIFGQSAGSIEVAALLAITPAQGLFRRAALHSTATHSSQTIDNANRMSELFVDILGVDPRDADALRAVSPARLVQASTDLLTRMKQEDPNSGRMHFNPVVDGDFLPMRPYDAVRNGAADDISIMVGTTLDETRLALGSEPPLQLDYASALAACRVFLGDEAERMMAAYTDLRTQRGLPASPTDVMFAIETDRVLRYPSIKLSEALSERDRPGYQFIFTYESPAMDGRLGAAHALELGFLFGTYTDQKAKVFNGDGPAADLLAERMQAAWTAFAATGDPSCASIGHWPTYRTGRETMLIGNDWHVANAPYEQERLLWEEFPGDARIGLM
ncbi:carboxylesterase/lipase family protein [Nocardia veterana]|uniref:Carboxylic ester hydrolase n=1 Tax=Nocardia veterana TaxID=132249 RepID=A0A7X6M3C6_9NOCA|nr:carboxylesterase/lipase family protein [Nocardia veterana]NKY89565.1 carboxylesterase/lipase family protein [Nocardia veterana]